MLYPIYAEQWELTPIVVTSVFATYQLALIVVLPLFGNLSDLFGRRLVMIAGVALIAMSALVFAVAPDVVYLFIGRVLQGAGAGLAVGAATASLIENNTTSNPRFASSLATVATSAGLTFALVLSGLFAQFLPMPLVWSYVVLLLLALASITALLLTPSDRPAVRNRWRPQIIVVPRGIRMNFVIATLSVALAYCVGAIFLSLGAHMITQFTHTTDTALVGILLACSALAIGVTALLLARVPVYIQVWVGTVLTVVSLALMGAASMYGSIALFLWWCVVGGVAYSFAFSGGLGLINSVAPERHRGATLSLIYLIAYAMQAVAAIGVGALATITTLSIAVVVAAATMTCLCALLVVFLGIRRRAAAHESQRTFDAVPR